jgi:hypothetical protein
VMRVTVSNGVTTASTYASQSAYLANKPLTTETYRKPYGAKIALTLTQYEYDASGTLVRKISIAYRYS